MTRTGPDGTAVSGAAGIAAMIVVRNERDADGDTIADVVRRAFAGTAHSDGSEPGIVDRLRRSGRLTVSLVAAAGDAVVGHIAFSPVTIDGGHRGWFGLAPLSVLPDWQGQGVGTALVRAGLERLRLRAAAGCVVFGDLAYYSRFGFVADPRLRYGAAPAGYFGSLAIAADRIAGGAVAYDPAFDG